MAKIGKRPYLVKCRDCDRVMERKNTKAFLCYACKNPKKYAPYKWEKTRGEVLERDGFACCVCQKSTNLHVHHKDGNRKNNHMDNLETRCNQCHPSLHRTKDAKVKKIVYGLFGTRLVYRAKLLKLSISKRR